MSSDSTNPAPLPEDFTAFLDGELDAARRAAVETWLAAHPDDAAEMDGQRKLAQLWQAHPPPEPSPAAWSATFHHIEQTLAVRKERRPPDRPRRWPLWLGVGAAAAVFAAVLIGRAFSPTPTPPEGPFPVATADDVVILSMDVKGLNADDYASRLVVGRPPVGKGALELSGQDEVTVMNVQPWTPEDGRAPHIGEGEVPMIVEPQLAAATGRDR